jgi:hypothetical protein
VGGARCRWQEGACGREAAWLLALEEYVLAGYWDDICTDFWCTVGDPHISYCFECKVEDINLIGCQTCKRSYHTECLCKDPVGRPSPKVSGGFQFWCAKCSERGWQFDPPADILPLSPVLSLANSPAPTRLTELEDASGHRTENQMLSGLQELAADLHDEVPRQPAFAAINRAPAGVQLAPASQQVAQRGPVARSYDLQPPSAALSPALSVDVARHAASALLSQGSRKPKSSRYQTMPSEVDQALAVIYRELESVTALKQDIEQLQNQVRSTEQARRMMENQLALARAGQDGVAQKNAEIATLKEQLADLRKSYEGLQEENARLKQQASSGEEVQALKSSLRRLLGE